MTKDIIDIILLIAIFIGILGLTYFVTQKMAMMSKKMNFNKNMEIIEVLQVGMGNYLYIIKIGEGYHLFSGGPKQHLTYCKEIDGTNFSIKEVPQMSFGEQLTHLMKGKKVDAHEKE